jgi:hypothetical protein
MPSSTKTQLSHVLHQLQEQVDVIEKYLAEENLPGPSFIPSEADSEVSQLMVLPPHIEAARNNAYSLSWGLNTLLANPQNHVTDLIFHVASLKIHQLMLIATYGCSLFTHRHGERYCIYHPY